MDAGSLINQITEMMDTVVFQVFLVIIVLCAILYFYFLPFAIAYARRHNYTKTVFLLNLLLGWTGLGWIFLLIWSFTGKKQQRKKYRSDGQTSQSDIVQERLKELTNN